MGDGSASTDRARSTQPDLSAWPGGANAPKNREKIPCTAAPARSAYPRNSDARISLKRLHSPLYECTVRAAGHPCRPVAVPGTAAFGRARQPALCGPVRSAGQFIKTEITTCDSS